MESDFPDYNVVEDGFYPLSGVKKDTDGVSPEKIRNEIVEYLDGELEDMGYGRFEKFYDPALEDILVESNEDHGRAVLYADIFGCPRPVANAILVKKNRERGDSQGKLREVFEIPNNWNVKINEKNLRRLAEAPHLE